MCSASKMNIALLLTFLTMAVTVESSTVPTSPSSGCLINGKWFAEGSLLNDDPCHACRCYQGRSACLIIDCAISPCVDPVVQSGRCCPTCPNGPNCLTPGGQLIPGEKDVKIDETTICRCHPFQGMGFLIGSQTATCTKISAVP